MWCGCGVAMKLFDTQELWLALVDRGSCVLFDGLSLPSVDHGGAVTLFDNCVYARGC